MTLLGSETLDRLLPLDPTYKGGQNYTGLRLFAVHCTERVLDLLTDPCSREALLAAHQYALGAISRERLEFAYTMADSVRVPKHKKQPHHWATIAATACASVECNAGPWNRGRTQEWAAIAAARIASKAASLAEQLAYVRSVEQVEAEQVTLLRRFVPECFEEDNGL